MNKDLKELAQRSFKLGQINGKCFIIENYLINALDCPDEDVKEIYAYIQDALNEVREIKKIIKSI